MSVFSMVAAVVASSRTGRRRMEEQDAFRLRRMRQAERGTRLRRVALLLEEKRHPAPRSAPPASGKTRRSQ
jgi:hypothetical protein